MNPPASKDTRKASLLESYDAAQIRDATLFETLWAKLIFLTPHLLPLRHDVANAVQYVAGAVGEALEVFPAGYTA